MECIITIITGCGLQSNKTTSNAIETNLLGGANSITKEMGYEFCVANDATNYKVIAKETWW